MPGLTLDPELDRLLPLEGEMIALQDLVDNLAAFDALIAVNTELQALVTNLYSLLAKTVAVVNDLYDATAGALFDAETDANFPRHVTCLGGVNVGLATNPAVGNLNVENNIQCTGYAYALGGIHVGGTTDPTNDNLVVDGQADVADFITALGGIHVGGTADPGTDNLVVDGQADVADFITALGGIHVGGTADPGTDNLVVDGQANLARLILDRGANLTIASDALTVTASYHIIDGETAPDNLSTINGGLDGAILFLHTLDSARDVTIKHNVGNILCNGAADILLDTRTDYALLFYDSARAKWIAQLFANTA
jgi:hypothetical protein